jgi:mannitol/fructose-specific phosphotransferase system IIA component (Ntr-type)
MKSLLVALEKGRLVELAARTKDEVLENLANLMEAIPEVGPGLDIVAAVKAREKEANSALGNGVAVPHARTPREGELQTVVGWSPAGIDYGAPDGQKVHLVIMFLIPESQRNAYLKSVSGLAKAIRSAGGIEDIINAPDLNTVRHKLLDWVAIALDTAVPDARARMIRLETKHAAVAQALSGEAQQAGLGLRLVPFSVLKLEGREPIILSQDKELVEALEKAPGLLDTIGRSNDGAAGGYRILVRSTAIYAAGRQLIDCLAIKLA